MRSQLHYWRIDYITQTLFSWIRAPYIHNPHTSGLVRPVLSRQDVPRYRRVYKIVFSCDAGTPASWLTLSLAKRYSGLESKYHISTNLIKSVFIWFIIIILRRKNAPVLVYIYMHNYQKVPPVLYRYWSKIIMNVLRSLTTNYFSLNNDNSRMINRLNVHELTFLWKL